MPPETSSRREPKWLRDDPAAERVVVVSEDLWRAVRGPGSPRDLVAALTRILAEADSSVRIGEEGTVQDAIDAYLYPRRLAAGMLTAAGLFGLLLAGIGIYGVVSGLARDL